MSDAWRTHAVSERMFLEWARLVVRSNGTMQEWADRNGCSVAFVSAVLTGRKPAPGWMLEAFGVTKRVVYDLPDEEPSNTFRQTAGFMLLDKDRRERV